MRGNKIANSDIHRFIANQGQKKAVANATAFFNWINLELNEYVCSLI